MSQSGANSAASNSENAGAGETGGRDLSPPKTTSQGWRKGESGPSQVCWPDYLDTPRAVDPYLVWADLTDFVDVGGLPESGNLPLLVELISRDMVLTDSSGLLSKECHPVLATLKITEAYKYKLQGQNNGVTTYTAARYVTAGVPLGGLDMLMKCSDSIVRFQLGLPRIPGFGTRARDLVTAVPSAFVKNYPRTIVGVIDDGCAFAHPNFSTHLNGVPVSRVNWLWDQDEQVRKPLPAPFDNAWKPPAGGLFGYGQDVSPRKYRLRTDGLDETQAYQDLNYAPMPLYPYTSGTQVTESAESVAMMRSRPHGTAVLDIAAGTDGEKLKREHSAKDSAEKWPLVFVQLPTRTTLDTSGASLGVHVLDGVRYVIDRAEDVAYELAGQVMSLSPLGPAHPPAAPHKSPNVLQAQTQFHLNDNPNSTSPIWTQRAMGENTSNQVVINVSYGALAGPHDGTSMLEMALEELVNLREGLHIVTAAGNAHRQHGHAAMDLVPGSGKTFIWQVGPDNPLSSFLEIWLPSRTQPLSTGEVSMALPPRSAQDFWLTVTSPEGKPVSVKSGDLWLLDVDEKAARACACAGVVFARRVAQGNNGTMVLLAVAPTGAVPDRTPVFRSLGPHGDWTIHVARDGGGGGDLGSGGNSVRVHAWVERNDLLYRNMRRQQSSVYCREDQPPEPTEFTPTSHDLAASRGTINGSTNEPYQSAYSMGTLSGGPTLQFGEPNVPKRRVVVAGAYRSGDGELAQYSSGGPGALPELEPEKGSHRVRPDFDAPSDESVSIRGLKSAAMRPGAVARLSGTSAAAPQVARFLAHLTYLISRRRDIELSSYIARRLTTTSEDVPAASRPTPTPVGDDGYRKGVLRLRPVSTE